MSKLTVRLKPQTHAKLKELAEEAGESLPETLAKAVEAYWRDHFFRQLNQGYAALRSDPKAWEEELAERRLWDATLADGLEDYPP
jgi:predicted transcriptional regulator